METKGTSYDSVNLRSRELHPESKPETSPTGFSQFDLHSWGVSRHLEAFLIRVELPRVPGIQEGASSVEESQFGGVCLGRST